MSDEIRKAILARRARFVALAVAGVGLASCGGEPQPRMCLSIPSPRDAGNGASSDDAGATESDAAAPSDDAGTTSADAQAPIDAGPPPMPCLSPALPPGR